MLNPKICVFDDVEGTRTVYITHPRTLAFIEAGKLEHRERIKDCAKRAFAKHGPVDVWVFDTEYDMWRKYQFKNTTTGTHYKRAKMATVAQEKLPSKLKLFLILGGDA